MTISVLMSVYNKEIAEKLERSLKSVWTDQTRKPDQIVLIQDGPLNDGLTQVIEKYKKMLGDRLTLYKNKENVGLTKSLNIGIGLVTSDLIARMDSDDISHPERFEKQIKYLEHHPEVYVLGGSEQEFNSKNPCIAIVKHPKAHQVSKYIAKASPVAHPAVMMRTSMFRDDGIKYDERYKVGQDIGLWFDVLCAGHVIDNIDDVVLFFEKEENYYTRRSKGRAMNELKMWLRGIYRLHGPITLLYVYPLMRYIVRMLPVPIIKIIYSSSLKKSFLSQA